MAEYPVRTKLTIMLGDGIIATELDKNVFQIGSRVRIRYNHKYQGEYYGTITERFENRGTCMVEFKESILEWRMRDLKLISEDEFQIGIIMEM